MSIKAEIIADSINSQGCRLTTYILEYPRFCHAEMLTHRMFSKNAASCLSGDTVITIEKPSKLKKGQKSKHTTITIGEIVNKWLNGDSLGRNMRNRLKAMNLRCLDEETGEFITTNIKDCVFSGEKELYEIELENGYKIKCTKEHRIFGENGWFTLNDLNLKETSFGLAWDANCSKVATNGISLSKEQILEHKNNGLSLTAISNLYSLNFKQLSNFCEKNRIFFRKKEVPNEDLSYKDRDWLEIQLKNGLYSHQIAGLCNTTIDRVKKSIKKLGLKGNRWTWGKKPVWNKGLTYSFSDEQLVNVRAAAQKRVKNSSYKNYLDFNGKMTRFLNESRQEILSKFNYTCQLTGLKNQLELHHIDPVWNNKKLAFAKGNLIPLNKKIHRFIHAKNLELELLRWINDKKPINEFVNFYKDVKKRYQEINKPVSKGNFLLVRYSKIISIKSVGIQKTYDLEVNGPYHNFIGNGIVVHNSRAIPIEKMIQQVIENPAMPVWWGKNQSGMQAKEELDNNTRNHFSSSIRIPEYKDYYCGLSSGPFPNYIYNLTQKEQAQAIWLQARDAAIAQVKKLHEIGLHKQIANRILEPWFNIRIILSGTEFENFFALRAHPDAQPEIQALAYKMLEEYNKSEPKKLNEGEWHIPDFSKLKNF